jgi:hypothetical protein
MLRKKIPDYQVFLGVLEKALNSIERYSNIQQIEQ